MQSYNFEAQMGIKMREIVHLDFDLNQKMAKKLFSYNITYSKFKL